MWNRAVLAACCAGALALASAPAASAQAGETAVRVYEREVFLYDRASRPDPFRSLLKDTEFGLRAEDLVLLGVIHDEDPARSVAMLAQTGSPRRIRVRAGDRLGGIRVSAIGPTSVELIVEEFGVSRREVIQLKAVPEKGSTS